MKRMTEIFARKLFGVKCEHLKKVLLIDMVVFWGLRTAGYRIAVSPFIIYFMVSAFSSGVMWRALMSEDNAANLKNLFMLPFEERTFVFSYVSVMGGYTLLTKTAGLLAVLLAVSAWSEAAVRFRLVYAAVCAVNAVLVTACVFTWRKRRFPGILWGGVLTAAIFLLWNQAVFFPVMAASCLLAAGLLSGTSAYAFYHQDNANKCLIKNSGQPSIGRYLLRYLISHKNYMMNTLVLWGIACVLPVFFRQIYAQELAQDALQDLARTQGQFVLPVGFAILSVNTPIGILLSCDPALERAVRFLPGQGKRFCIPYILFIFLCNMTADLIFLGSSWFWLGGVPAAALMEAVLFALLAAAGSVLLEWFFPIRNWKIENDLWHHPRKYVVPAATLLLAGLAAAVCGL